MITLIEQIESDIQENKTVVEIAEALQRLRKNRDFKRIIEEGYFYDEAVRLVHLKSDPAFQTPERQRDILTQIDAIGALSQYFQTIRHRAGIAAKAIDAGIEERDALLAEEAE